jgi:hypothetical protein
MALYGNKNVKSPTPRAIKLGNSAYFGIPVGMKLDQVKLPNAYIIPPKIISWNIVTLTKLVPGIGLFILLNKEYFCIQYIKNIPKIAKNAITGCRETKKQVNKYKLTKYTY